VAGIGARRLLVSRSDALEFQILLAICIADSKIGYGSPSSLGRTGAPFMCTWLALSVLCVSLAGVPALEGTVIDADGKPIREARVDISTAAPKVGPGIFCPSCYRDCGKSARTDAEGNFRIESLDPTLKFRILVSSSGHKTVQTPLTDPSAGPLSIRLEEMPKDLPASRMAGGIVVDDQGHPIEGALVEPSGGRTAERRWHGSSAADPVVTDRKGRFTIVFPEGYLGIDVTIIADGHAGARANLLTPGEDRRIEVPTGTQVTGRLVQNGKPIAGLRVAVVQADRSTDHFIKAVADTSDDEGRFSMDNLPADQRYAIFSVAGESAQPLVLTTKRFKAHANRELRDLGDLEVIAPLKLVGRVELPDGVPVGIKLSLGREPAWDLISVDVQPDGSFAIEGLPPESYSIYVIGKNVKLASTLPFQILNDHEFGLHLDQSLTDLRIPLEIAPAK
jgi:uncharacterized GH25 family protein